MPWIFRSPEPITERLRANSSDEWPVEHHHSLVSPGDLVFFWEGDARGRIVGVGRIQTAPYRTKTGKRPFVARVGRAIALALPLKAEECRNDRILQGLPVFRRGASTNYGITKAHTDRLLALIGKGEPALADSLNMSPSQIPAVEDARAAEPPQEESSQPTPASRGRDIVFTDELAERVRAFLSDPTVAIAHRLRTDAHERIKRILQPEVLAEITAERFQQEVMEPGEVLVDGETMPLHQALERLREVTGDEVEKMIGSGALRTTGNLTWRAQHLTMDESGESQEPARLSIRLRAALSHLFAVNRPLVSRIDRMRRSVDALWPETATGILMILHPLEHVVYHEDAARALQALGCSEPIRYTLGGYDHYRALVADLEEHYSFGSNSLIDLFLTMAATSLPSTQEDERPNHVRADDVHRARPAAAHPPTDTSLTQSEHLMKPTGARPSPSSSEPEQQQPAITPAADSSRKAVHTEGQAVFALYQHMRHSGLVITIEDVINLCLCLKTTPILVLDGPAGIGKDRVACALAEGMGAQLSWLPMTNETGVGPANSPLRLRDLLGQVDPRTGEYRPEPLFETLLAAHEDPETAYVVCIDTIDGWQEDAWLSEYVRLLDTGTTAADGRWTTLPIIPVPGLATLRAVDGRTIPGRLPLPDNIFLILATMGRVGLGDITVERSNVVELGPADLALDAVRPGHKPEGTTPGGFGRMLVAGRTCRRIGDFIERPWMETWNEELVLVSGMLDDMDLGIGYRLRDDILRYLAYADDLSAELPYGVSFPLEVAFDRQIAQRVVPRLMTREPNDEVVSELLMYAQGSREMGALRFPRTAAVLEGLQRRME